MSRFYRKTNFESTIDLFEKKLIYNLKAKMTTSQKNLVNFTFAEKQLYGRVDRLYLPIVPSNSGATLKDVKTKGTNRVQALNFVADAFEDVVKQFRKKMHLNEISKEEKYLSDFKANNGYIPPKAAYNKHIKIYFRAFERVIKENKIKFSNFNEFVIKIMPYILQTAKKKPLTFPAFVKSKFCPMECSGLVIDISDIEFENDEKKIEHFYDNKNWEFYVNVCASYGFMIDRNHPSRLVADIASADMLRYAENYGILTTDQVLNTAYSKAHFRYLETFKVILFRMYNEFKPVRIHRSAEISPGRIKNIIETPIKYTFDNLKEEYNDAYFLNLYCRIRIAEEESRFGKGETYSLISDTIEMSHSNLTKAMNSFEVIINKTFDYNGSLSYNKMKADKLRE
jgi:hypothetical protein